MDNIDVDEEAIEVDREVLVRFVCGRCESMLGKRYLVPPLFDESEFRERDTPAWLAVEDRLRSKGENETVDVAWSPVGPPLAPVLGIHGARAPRTGAMLWRAEYGPNGVLVHIACGCGCRFSRLLDSLVTEALEAAAGSPQPLVKL